MINTLKIIALLAIITVFLYQQRDITALSSIIETQQHALDTLRDEMTLRNVQSTLALKLSLVNKNTIQNIKKMKIVEVTAYSPNEQETDDTPFHTASNRKVRNGIVAVSRDLFNQGWVFGRKIYINSLGIYTIDDLMADSKKNQIDIFMFDSQQAISFGRKTLEAHLLVMEPLPSPTSQLENTNKTYSMN